MCEQLDLGRAFPIKRPSKGDALLTHEHVWINSAPACFWSLIFLKAKEIKIWNGGSGIQVLN